MQRRQRRQSPVSGHAVPAETRPGDGARRRPLLRGALLAHHVGHLHGVRYTDRQSSQSIYE